MKKNEILCFSNTAHIAIGSVIQSNWFSLGIQMNDNQTVLIGWLKDEQRMNHYAHFHKAIIKKDQTRNEKKYLVIKLELNFDQYPDDVSEDYFFEIRIQAIEINSDDTYNQKNEKIEFTINSPVSLIDIPNSEIKIVKHIVFNNLI